MPHKRPNILSRPVLAALLLSNLTIPATASEQQTRIFHHAPPPEVLAEILFPPRYRGAAPNDSAASQGGLFGMRIQFDFDSADIRPESESMLESVGEMMGLEALSGRAVVIEGHTDAVGNDAYNQALSEKRARAIRAYLIDKFGVTPKRLVAVGKGERELYEKNNPNAAVNRRAMFRPMKKLVLK